MSDYIDFEKIPQRVEEVENLYATLYQSNRNIGLLIPTNIKTNQLGIKTSLCQFINTWFRYTNDKAPLYTYVNKEADIETQIENLCNQFHGLVAVGMASHTKKIVDNSNSIEFTQKAKKIFIERVKRMQGVEQHGKFLFDKEIGKPLMLICFDHLAIDELKYLHWLYEFDSDPQIRKFAVRNIKYFDDLFIRIVQSQRIKETKKVESLKGIVGGILEELFKNTDDWARNGFGENNGVPIATNMRGIFAEVHHGSMKHFKKVSEGSKPLEKYFSHSSFYKDDSDDSKSSFLEISILDSGPGYSQRKSDKEITEEKSLTSEYDDIIGCLAKYESSSQSVESRIRGRGLKTVAELCSNKGFFKIRTSRLCVYRDFVLNPYNSGIKNSEYFEEIETIKSKINDWLTCNKTLTKFHFAEGSLITIYYPLDSNMNVTDQLSLQI